MPGTRQDATITPRLITALDRTWAAIQKQHPDVPAVVIALGAGSGPKAGLKLGHFAAGRWQRADAKLPELFVGGEGLARGARGVLGTLLHEAAHGIASVREIRDTGSLLLPRLACDQVASAQTARDRPRGKYRFGDPDTPPALAPGGHTVVAAGPAAAPVAELGVTVGDERGVQAPDLGPVQHRGGVRHSRGAPPD